jgi:hypothetical protein
MRLHAYGREYYKLRLTTYPGVALDAWEASFDGGTTWTQATVVTVTDDPDATLNGSWSGWLVAGEHATDNPAGTAVITSDVYPRVRLADSPELLVRDPSYPGGPPAVRYAR